MNYSLDNQTGKKETQKKSNCKKKGSFSITKTISSVFNLNKKNKNIRKTILSRMQK